MRRLKVLHVKRARYDKVTLLRGLPPARRQKLARHDRLERRRNKRRMRRRKQPRRRHLPACVQSHVEARFIAYQVLSMHQVFRIFQRSSRYYLRGTLSGVPHPALCAIALFPVTTAAHKRSPEPHQRKNFNRQTSRRGALRSTSFPPPASVKNRSIRRGAPLCPRASAIAAS